MENFSDLILSTITVEAKISNIKFKEYELIHKLSLNNKSDIIKIGCNYQEYISNEYLELTKPVQKSNRGRKKKEKPVSTRKVQGNGKYFNSQITFTVLDKDNKEKFYHLKLFTNGTIQIPFVCNENILIIKPIIELVIDTIKEINSIKENILQPIEIVYIKSIMRNYGFSITHAKNYIDLYKFQEVLTNYKNLQTDNELAMKYLDHVDLLNTFKLGMIKCNFERYTGIILKFHTPIEGKPNKFTTMKIFSSGKINIDGCNCIEEAKKIQHMIYVLIFNNFDYLLYSK